MTDARRSSDVAVLDYLSGVLAELDDIRVDALHAKAAGVIRAQAAEIERLRDRVKVLSVDLDHYKTALREAEGGR